MAIECSCKGICSRHLKQALQNNAGQWVNGPDLYDASFALKEKDPSALSAAHDKDVERCGRCKKTFHGAAAQHNKTVETIAQLTQSLEVLALPAPKTPA